MNTQTNEADNVIDNVNAPKHYTSHASVIECIQIAELLPFNLGSALKYVWRRGLKWNESEDVQKAIFYLRRQEQLGSVPTYTVPVYEDLQDSVARIYESGDAILGEICNTIVFGEPCDWDSLADLLGSDYYDK